MEIKKNIKQFFSNKSLVIFVAGALFVLLFLRQCNQIDNLKAKVEMTEKDSQRNFNNYLASKDSVRIIKAENGNLISQKRSYEFDLSNLKGDQKDLIEKYKDALNLNRNLNKVNTLLAADLKIKDNFTAETSFTKIDSASTKIKFTKFDDFGNGNSRDLLGEMLITKNKDDFKYSDAMFSINHKINLMAAIENVDGADQLKISTSYPGLSFSNIENINLINTRLNQKPVKKGGFAIGVGLGYGVNLNNNQIISTGPSIGFGLYYSPKWLRF
jgi:hypothetical protein